MFRTPRQGHRVRTPRNTPSFPRGPRETRSSWYAHGTGIRVSFSYPLHPKSGVGLSSRVTGRRIGSRVRPFPSTKSLHPGQRGPEYWSPPSQLRDADYSAGPLRRSTQFADRESSGRSGRVDETPVHACFPSDLVNVSESFVCSVRYLN